MKTLKLADGLTFCGVQDPSLKVFDIVMETRYGTTYNAYVLEGSEKTALIETAKHKFLGEYMASLDGLVDVKKIDYIVVSHTEPDHAGSIEHLLELNPEIQIVATSTAIGFLRHIVNRDFRSIPVKDGDRLELGGKTLLFMPLPNLHWPDTMFTLIEEDGALVTCDAFGAHFSHPGILRSTVTDENAYRDALKYYFDGIIGPFKRPYMTAALSRIKDLNIRMILTGHGPVLDSHVEETIAMYSEWCQPDSPFQKRAIIIAYVSAYGYTRSLAEGIAEGIRAAGDVEVRLHDMVTDDPRKVLEEIEWADGFLLGTPTMVGEALKPIWDLTSDMLPPMVKGKRASAFGSYGWSGEGVPHIIERLKQLRLKVSDGLRVRFKPDDKQLTEARAFGEDFARLVLSDPPAEKPADAPAPEKAVSPKVRCTVCNAVFEADKDTCPVCGAGPDKFVPFGSREAALSEAHAPETPVSRKVRCTVCNAVFEADKDICPVCGAGPDKFVPADAPSASGGPAPAESAKARCTVCGATVDAALDNCPLCGAARGGFEPLKAPVRAGKPGGKVRCLVCGEVFDASFDVCPVCGAGRESFVPVEDAAPVPTRDTEERFLIIGGGAAGYNAAKAVRERNKTAPVVILSAEEDLPYNRPMLTKTLLTDFDCGKIAISPKAWYEENDITLLTGVAATAVDADEKRVTTSTGATLAYDKLIFAAGARCFRPPIPGMDFDNVISIRSAGDALKIEKMLPTVKNAVVIGGGVLGIEAAWELKKAGANVTVIETLPRIMPRQLDEGAARTLSMLMEKKGLALRTGAAVCAIEGDGRAERVALRTGETFPADLVIVSTGVVPNAELLVAAGAKATRAVVVDHHMATTLPDVYAAGDCAECDGVNFALWAQAVEEGRAAGANAAGDAVEYPGVTGALTLNALDTSLYAVGEHGTSGAYRAEERRDDEKGFYEKLYYRGERLAGFILIGDMARLTELNNAFGGHAGL